MANKRGQNEGSVTKRRSGRWQAQASLDGVRISKSFDTRKECMEWIRELANRQQHGLTGEYSKLSLKDFFTHWLESAKPNLKAKTWEQYKRNAELHILPVLGTKRIAELRPLDIQALNTANRKKGLSPRMVQMAYSILHTALNRSVKWGVLPANPAAAVDRPKVPKKEMRVLTDEQVRALLMTAQDHRLRVMFRLAITGGFRLGELLGLKWRDVDWSSSTIQVQRQLQRNSQGGMETTTPKTPKSVRAVQLGTESLRELMRHFENQRHSFGEDPKPDAFIFLGRTGNPIRKSGVLKAFKSLLKESGLPNLRFHDLRYTAASLMLSAGMPVIQVARQLGHSQASTTLDVYGHLIPGLDSGAAEKLDQMLTPVAAGLQQREIQDVKKR